jgi:hypothetical protein
MIGQAPISNLTRTVLVSVPQMDEKFHVNEQVTALDIHLSDPHEPDADG